MIKAGVKSTDPEVFEDWNFEKASDHKSACIGASIFQAEVIENHLFTIGSPGEIHVFGGEDCYGDDEANERGGLHLSSSLEKIIKQELEILEYSRSYVLSWAEELERLAKILWEDLETREETPEGY